MSVSMFGEWAGPAFGVFFLLTWFQLFFLFLPNQKKLVKLLSLSKKDRLKQLNNFQSLKAIRFSLNYPFNDLDCEELPELRKLKYLIALSLKIVFWGWGSLFFLLICSFILVIYSNGMHF